MGFWGFLGFLRRVGEDVNFELSSRASNFLFFGLTTLELLAFLSLISLFSESLWEWNILYGTSSSESSDASATAYFAKISSTFCFLYYSFFFLSSCVFFNLPYKCFLYLKCFFLESLMNILRLIIANVDCPIITKFTTRCMLTINMHMYPIVNLISGSETSGEKQIMVYMTSIRMTSLNISTLLLNRPENGYRFPTIMTEMTICDDMAIICTIKVFSKLTIAMASMNLLAMKKKGWMRASFPTLKSKSLYKSPN